MSWNDNYDRLDYRHPWGYLEFDEAVEAVEANEEKLRIKEMLMRMSNNIAKWKEQDITKDMAYDRLKVIRKRIRKENANRYAYSHVLFDVFNILDDVKLDETKKFWKSLFGIDSMITLTNDKLNEFEDSLQDVVVDKVTKPNS